MRVRPSRWVGDLRVFVFALCALATTAGRAAAALPCQNALADPCVISSSATIAVGTYDIRPRSLVVNASKTITLSGTGTFAVLANNITFQAGSRIVNASTGPNVTVTLMATGTISLQSQGTSKSKIDVTGTDGGNINLIGGGDVSVIGSLTANATNQFGAGGSIIVHSDTGNVTVGGDPNEGIRAQGDSEGGGGFVSLEATVGSINVSTQLAPKGGDCGGCEVDMTAGLDITTTTAGIIDMTPSGAGDGGTADIEANRNILIQGNVTASGGAGTQDTGGGSGGDLTFIAGGDLTLNARIGIDGASPDGDGGAFDAESGGTLSHSGGLFARAVGFGQGDEMSYDSTGDINISSEVDVDADNLSGDITVLADGKITVSSNLHSVAPINPTTNPFALGGTLDIEACQIALTSTGILTSTGPGGGDAGDIFLAASTGMTIAGHVTSTAGNEFDYRTSPPVLTGSTITPAPVISQQLGLPCCGVNCTTTTTTTTSTTTTTKTTTTSTTVTATTATVTTTTKTTTSTLPGGTTTTTTTTQAPTTTTTTTSTTTTTKTTTSTTTTSTTTTSTTTTKTTTTSPSTTLTTTTSTIASTTSTTLPSVCPSVPLMTCRAASKATIVVNEKTFGKEQLKVVIGGVLSPVAQTDFGNPVAGATAYTVCLYDQGNALVDTVKVARAGNLCAGNPCWKALSTVGYKYTDKLLTAFGIKQITLKGGAMGKGQATIKGKNDLPHGFTALPTKVAKKLTGNRTATVQLLTSDAACFTASLTNVTQADGIMFKGSLR
jgi:hypothetical protein